MASRVTMAPFEIEQAQEFGNGGDLVAFFVHGLLGEGKAIVLGPGADDLHGAFIAFAASSQGFAVDVDQSPFEVGRQGGDVGDEAFSKESRIERREEAKEGIGTGNAVGQGDPLFEPFSSCFGKAHEVFAGVHAADDG